MCSSTYPWEAEKSLSYAMLPIASDIMTGLDGSFIVVVSPLIVLINDQIEAFSAKGLKAVHYHAQYGVATS